MRAKKYPVWAHSVLAVFAGSMAGLITAVTIVPLLPTFLLRGTVYTFVGGIVAGFVGRRHGWAYGLLSALIVEGCFLAFDIWAFSWSAGVSGILMVRLKDWYWSLLTLCAGTAGGYVGGLIALHGRRARENLPRRISLGA